MAPARDCSLRHLLSCAAHTGTAIRPCESRGIPAAPSRALIVTPSPSALATRVRVCLAAVRTFLVRVFLHLFTFNLHARIRTPQTAGSHPTMPTPPKTTSPECILPSPPLSGGPPGMCSFSEPLGKLDSIAETSDTQVL